MKTTPSFDAYEDAKKFFYEDDEGERHIARLLRATVVVTTASGGKVAFGKSNRGENYQDSRGKKVTKTDEWGEKTTVIRKLMISADECRSELHRLLCDDNLAAEAWSALQV